MDNSNVLKEILKFVQDSNGKKAINCPDAQAIAKKMKLQPTEIAKVLNSNNIKIINCRLGCF